MRVSNQQCPKMLALFFHPREAQPPVPSLSFQCADAVSFSTERKCWPLATVAQKTIQVEPVFFAIGGNFISFNICRTPETWTFTLSQNMVHHNPQKLILQNTVLHKACRVPQIVVCSPYATLTTPSTASCTSTLCLPSSSHHSASHLSHHTPNTSQPHHMQCFTMSSHETPSATLHTQNTSCLVLVQSRVKDQTCWDSKASPP